MKSVESNPNTSLRQAQDSVSGEPAGADCVEQPEPSPLTPRKVAWQFFVHPMLLVLACLGLMGFVLWLTYDGRTAQDLLALVQSAHGRQRWQAAHEFAQRLNADESLQADPRLAGQVLTAFEEVREKQPDVAAFMAQALGLMAPALSTSTHRAETALVKALESGNASLRIQATLALVEINAKGSIRDLSALLHDTDSGVRKAAAYAIGRLGKPNDAGLLAALLDDHELDVRWNAALGLSNLGSDAGTVVLREMLSRDRLEQLSHQSQKKNGPGMNHNEVSNIMINAIRAVVKLNPPEFRETLKGLQDRDSSARVRQTARLALEQPSGEKQQL